MPYVFVWRFVMVLLLFSGLIDSPRVLAGVSHPDRPKIEAVLKMYTEYKKDFRTVRDISPEAAQALAGRGKVIFIDVRKPAERRVSMLPGAVTEESFLSDPSRFLDKTAVAYCTIGYRSGMFAEKMSRRHIPVVNLAGGILAWVLNGGAVYANGAPTTRVHVYGEKWNYLPEGYEAVLFGFLEKTFGD